MYKDNLNNMMCLDIYLAYIADEEYRRVRHRIRPLHFKPHPLMSRDVLCDSPEPIPNNKEQDLKALRIFYEKYLWQINLEKIVSRNYESLVLTDPSQTIQWVSDGFKGMTGYEPAEAIGRKPVFLQGKNTTLLSRKRLRKGLDSGKPFAGPIINYRKNGEEYMCMVKVFPVPDNKNNITHFLALEKEIL